VIRFQKFRPGLDVALLPKFEQISGSKVENHDVTRHWRYRRAREQRIQPETGL